MLDNACERDKLAIMLGGRQRREAASMRLHFLSQKDIFTLGDVPKGFLQVLLPEFTLTKVGQEGKGRLLEITLRDDLLAVGSSAGKKQFFELVRKSSAAGKTCRNIQPLRDYRAFNESPAGRRRFRSATGANRSRTGTR